MLQHLDEIDGLVAKGERLDSHEEHWLRTQLRTALADTRRVDWLQEKAVWFQGGEEWDAGINSESIDIPLIEAGGNLRKACDAAMAATQKET